MTEFETTTTTPAEAKTALDFSMAGLAYTPMPLGAIRIGHAIALPGGGSMPIRDDEFRITQPMRGEDGGWLADPLDAALREKSQQVESTASAKLRQIPIRLHVNDPSLTVRSRFEAFDNTTRRTVCASNGGGVAKRWTGTTGTTDVACVGSDRCEFANSGSAQCKFFGRIAVQIQGQDGELGTYVMRTSSVNTLRTFEAKLWQFWSVLGRKLRGVPFVMKLRSAQTELSNWSTFHFVDLELDGVKLGQAKAAATAQGAADERDGLDIADLEKTMHEGLRNGGYLADTAEDGVDLSEFLDASKFTASASNYCGHDASTTVTMRSGGAAKTTPAPDAASQGDAITATPAVEPVVSRPVSVSASDAGIYMPGFGKGAKRAAVTKASTTPPPTVEVKAAGSGLDF